MWRWLVLAAVATVALVAVLVLRGDEGGELVAHVRDGDTVELAGGEVVRLVQIDTPELAEGRWSRGARPASGSSTADRGVTPGSC